jgi:GTP-binding protein HflX
LLVAVIPTERKRDKEHALHELRGLVKTAGVTVVDELTQVRDKPHAASCLGKGKVEELAQLAKMTDVDLIIFDNNLSPAQGRHVEEETDTIVVDRSEVILDIFAERARTYESRLQVELAQLLYYRPRLKRMWTHLERIEGGVGTGRGPGEKQLETDRRLLDRRVAELKRRLASVEKRRERTVRQRSDQITVSLVGYTNAGKSTLMNVLTESEVFVADKLFATLDTRTRKWSLPNWGAVLLSDTVGFVRDLPHHLVASFKSTLEEARQADLLLHVVDASSPDVERQIKTVYEVLEDVGVEHGNDILVLNKADAVENRAQLDILRSRHVDSVSVSAVNGTGIERLTEMVAERLSDGYVDAEIETSVGNGRLFAWLAEHATVTETRYHYDTRVTFECRLPRRFTSRLEDADTTVRVAAPVLTEESDEGE